MSEIHKQVTQHPRQRCYFCGSEGPIETHHIVPRRHDGSDDETNLVDLCPTCHERLEALYNKRFYESISGENLKNDGTTQENKQHNKNIETVRKTIVMKVKNLSDEYPQTTGAPVTAVKNAVYEQEKERGFIETRSEVERQIEYLVKSEGKLYRPDLSHLASP